MPSTSTPNDEGAPVGAQDGARRRATTACLRRDLENALGRLRHLRRRARLFAMGVAVRLPTESRTEGTRPASKKNGEKSTCFFPYRRPSSDLGEGGLQRLARELLAAPSSKTASGGRPAVGRIRKSTTRQIQGDLSKGNVIEITL
jgi:hypothetical protein